MLGLNSVSIPDSGFQAVESIRKKPPCIPISCFTHDFLCQRDANQVFDHLPLEGSTTKQHKPQVSKNAAAKQQNKTLQKLPKKPPKGRAKWSKKHSTTRMNQAAEQPLKRSRTSQILAIYEHTRKRQHPHQRRTAAQPTARDRRAQARAAKDQPTKRGHKCQRPPSQLPKENQQRPSCKHPV
ncbi:hypothetical protein LXL04_028056 [Taraxacum kok-saghyz]